MNELDLDRLGKEISVIARQAGAAILKIYNAAHEIEVTQKADDSPLTNADLAANRVINEGLERLPVKFPVLSEENREIPYEVRKNYPYFWLVDPLDGTKEFIKRNGEFTVNIALIKGQSPVLGVIYAPCLDELYIGYGQFAMCKKSGKTEPLKAPEFSIRDKGLKVVCSRSHINSPTQGFINALEDAQTLPMGSSLKFMIIARGAAHIYPRAGLTSEWDTAAAQAILTAAGGKILQWGKPEALIYNKENFLNPHFIAYGRVVEK